MAEYRDREPFKLQWRREGDWIHYVIEEHDDPPVEIALIAGDALYNARAALDHVVCELAVLHDLSTPAAQQRQTMYPVTPTRRRFRDKIGYLEHRIGKEAAGWLLEADACHAGNQLLWQLDELNNVDKHRALFTTATYHHATEVAPGLRPKAGLIFDMPETRFHFGELVDGAIVMRIRSQEPLSTTPQLQLRVGLNEKHILGGDSRPLEDIVTSLIDAALEEVFRIRAKVEECSERDRGKAKRGP